MAQSSLATLLPLATTSALTVVPNPCRDCRWGECRFRTMTVRSYIIAYREALKGGDDPAEYIRDCIRSSRPDTPIEPAIRGGPKLDSYWPTDVKIGLERARDIGGIALNVWNAERVARYLCERAAEAPVDSEGTRDV